jgi:small nuclear ribonucleoprotein (snRNP)-like protein
MKSEKEFTGLLLGFDDYVNMVMFPHSGSQGCNRIRENRGWCDRKTSGYHFIERNQYFDVDSRRTMKINHLMGRTHVGNGLYSCWQRVGVHKQTSDGDRMGV